MSTPTIEQRLRDVFAPVDGGDLAALVKAFAPRDVAAGASLTSEGQSSDTLFVLHAGALRVSIADVAASSVELGEIPAGVPFGEVSFVDARPATATVSAAAPCTVLALTRDGLDALRRDHPRAAGTVLRAVAVGLADRIRRSSDRLDQLTLGTTTGPEPRAGWLAALRSLFGSGKER